MKKIIFLVLSSLTVGVVTDSEIKALSIVNNGSSCSHHVKLQCNILQNFSDIHISWEKENQELCYWKKLIKTSEIQNQLNSGNRISCHYTANQLTLTIEELSNDDEGLYYCKLRTNRHDESKNTSLNDCSKISPGMPGFLNKAETTTTGLMWLLLSSVLASFLNL